MGLDAYIWRARIEDVIDDFTIKEKSGDKIFYWRTNYPLQNWMKHLYKKKGGTEEFNCEIVRLELDDLISLEKVIKVGFIPDIVPDIVDNNTHVFITFDYSARQKAEQDYIGFLKNEIEKGFAIYYYSWW